MGHLSKIAVLATVLSTSVFAADFSATKTKLEQAMKAEIRTEAETKRDRNRNPIATLEFFGFRDDMKVVEFVPGGGWYTKLLAPVVAEKGEYYAALGANRVVERMQDTEGFKHIKLAAKDSNIFRKEGARFYSIETGDVGVSGADMVFTFRNYHNFAEDGRMAMNKAAFDALKSGGIYAVVDHTARHMEPQRDTNRRRFDPVKAIKEIQDAGFEFVDFTELHYKEDDELEYEVGAQSVRGNTDRWTLKFRKP